MTDNRAEALKSIPLFADLSASALGRVAAATKEVEVAAGHVLVRPGTKGTGAGEDAAAVPRARPPQLPQAGRRAPGGRRLATRDRARAAGGERRRPRLTAPTWPERRRPRRAAHAQRASVQPRRKETRPPTPPPPRGRH